MSAGIRDGRTRSVMTRIKGIHVLALSIVLWGFAVWLLGTPHPAETETTAETASDEAPPAGHAVDTGTDAERAAGIETEHAAVSPPPVSASPAPARDGSGAPRSDGEVGSASARTALAPAGKTGAAPAPAGTRSSPAQVGEMQLATAPSWPESDDAASTTRIPQGARGRESTTGPAPGAVQPFRQFEYPMPPSLPPARCRPPCRLGGPARGGARSLSGRGAHSAGQSRHLG